LKTHAASVEASARERVRKVCVKVQFSMIFVDASLSQMVCVVQVQEECEKETEAAVREADAAHEKALERARQEASAQQQELVVCISTSQCAEGCAFGDTCFSTVTGCPP